MISHQELVDRDKSDPRSMFRKWIKDIKDDAISAEYNIAHWKFKDAKADIGQILGACEAILTTLNN